MKRSKSIFLLLALGLVLRLFVSYFQYSGDVKNHVVWSQSFLNSPKDFYETKIPGFNDPNYPPLAIFFFAFSKVTYDLTSSAILWFNQFSVFPSGLVPLVLSENTLMAFYKLPGILADLVIAYFVYYYFKSKDQKKALTWSSLFLFNPALIYVSTVWGQIESLTALFLVLSFLFSSSPLSFVYFSLAVLTKQTALWVLPLYLIIWFKALEPKKIISGSLSALAVFFSSYLVFGKWPLSAITSYLSTLSGSSTVVSDAAWNLWFLFYPAGTNDDVSLVFTSVRNLSIALLLISLLPILYRLMRQKSLSEYAISLSAWSALVFFLQTRVHERHFYPSLIFLYFINTNHKLKIITLIILSSLFLANLYDSLGLSFI